MAERALLARVRVRIHDRPTTGWEMDLDAWPLVRLDRAAGTLAVNDLRCRTMFTHAVALSPPPGPGRPRLGAVADELCVLVGGTAVVFVVCGAADDIHARVQVVASTGRLLLERTVRYRQLPAAGAAPVIGPLGG